MEEWLCQMHPRQRFEESCEAHLQGGEIIALDILYIIENKDSNDFF
jgi:hypothetical protein